MLTTGPKHNHRLGWIFSFACSTSKKDRISRKNMLFMNPRRLAVGMRGLVFLAEQVSTPLLVKVALLVNIFLRVDFVFETVCLGEQLSQKAWSPNICIPQRQPCFSPNLIHQRQDEATPVPQFSLPLYLSSSRIHWLWHLHVRSFVRLCVSRRHRFRHAFLLESSSTQWWSFTRL